MARPALVDGRNIFDPTTARNSGFDYTGIGRRQKEARRAPAGEAAVI
jgi:hypothetical protein